MRKKTVLLNPTAKKDAKGEISATERVSAFCGKTIGFLNNSKPNSDLLQKKIRECIDKSYENVRFINVTKTFPAKSLNDNELEQLVNNCNLVINGVGD